MNCQEYRDMIEDALDISLHGELEMRVRRHLEHCEGCRAYFVRRRSEHILLFTSINAAYSHLRSPPDGFADRIVREVEARRNVRRSWRRFALPRWVLIAASLALMAGFVFAATVVVDAVMSGGAGHSALSGDEMVGRGVPDALDSPILNDAFVALNNQLSTLIKGEETMNNRKTATVALSAALAAAPLTAAVADGGGYTSASYVQDGLIAQWDGIDNVGTGTHNPIAAVWKDLKGSCDMTLCNNGESWMNGNALYVNGAGAAGSTAAPRYTTIEVVYKMASGACLFVSGLKWGNTDWYISRIVAFSGGTRAIFTNAHSGQTIYIPDANGDVVHSLSAVYEDNRSDVVVSASMDGYVRTQNTVQTSWYDATGVVMVGDRKTTARSEPWAGEIYAIRLYDRALSVGELAANQKVDEARFGVSGWYRCIASGDPIAASTANSYAAAEEAPTAAIEARGLTRDWSDGIALDATEQHLGTMFSVR